MRFLDTYPSVHPKRDLQRDRRERRKHQRHSLMVRVGSFVTKATTGRLARPTMAWSRARGPRTTAAVKRTSRSGWSTLSTTRVRRLNEQLAQWCRRGPEYIQLGREPTSVADPQQGHAHIRWRGEHDGHTNDTSRRRDSPRRRPTESAEQFSWIVWFLSRSTLSGV